MNKNIAGIQAQPLLFLSWSSAFCHGSWQICHLIWILDYNETRGNLKKIPLISIGTYFVKEVFHVRFQILLSSHFLFLEFQTLLPQFLGSTNILNIIFISLKNPLPNNMRAHQRKSFTFIYFRLFTS